LAVKHDILLENNVKIIRKYGKKKHVFFDLKYAFAVSESDEQL